jgi:hypothetical protein
MSQREYLQNLGFEGEHEQLAWLHYQIAASNGWEFGKNADSDYATIKKYVVDSITKEDYTGIMTVPDYYGSNYGRSNPFWTLANFKRYPDYETFVDWTTLNIHHSLVARDRKVPELSPYVNCSSIISQDLDSANKVHGESIRNKISEVVNMLFDTRSSSIAGLSALTRRIEYGPEKLRPFPTSPHISNTADAEELAKLKVSYRDLQDKLSDQQNNNKILQDRMKAYQDEINKLNIKLKDLNIEIDSCTIFFENAFEALKAYASDKTQIDQLVFLVSDALDSRNFTVPPI